MREKNEMLAGIKHDAIVANIKRVKYSYNDNNINSGKNIIRKHTSNALKCIQALEILLCAHNKCFGRQQLKAKGNNKTEYVNELTLPNVNQK